MIIILLTYKFTTNRSNNYIILILRDAIFKFDASNIENLRSPYFISLNLPANSEQKEQCIATYYDEVENLKFLLIFTIENNSLLFLNIHKIEIVQQLHKIHHKQTRRERFVCMWHIFVSTKIIPIYCKSDMP